MYLDVIRSSIGQVEKKNEKMERLEYQQQERKASENVVHTVNIPQYRSWQSF